MTKCEAAGALNFHYWYAVAGRWNRFVHYLTKTFSLRAEI